VDVNVKGTLSILDACANNNVKSFVFASSAAVYGNAKLLPIREDYSLEPLSPYGASKVSGEALVTSYKGSGKIKNAISLRFFNVYGEGQSSQYAGVITKFAERLSKGLPPVIFGSGIQTRDFVSVNDVVNAIMKAAQADDGISGIFNIGTGRPVSINELARKMIEAFNLDLEPTYAEAKKGDIEHSYANITKSREIFGFTPANTIESSLKQTLNWLSGPQEYSKSGVRYS
jgi:UDP-glucose 4-epimerase